MNRRLTALFAAAEALLVLGIGLAVPLAIATVLWATHFGFAPEWLVFWRASADIWLLGHGVDVTFVLDPVLAAAVGDPGAGEPVDVTIAILGFALLTFVLAIRAGRRATEVGHPLLGGVVSVVVFGVGSLAVVLLSLHPQARASIVQAAILPTLVFAGGLAFGMFTARDGRGRRVIALPALAERIPRSVAAGVGVAIRVGLGGAAAVLAAASVLTALALAVGYAALISLYEALQTGVLGGAVLTVAQLAMLPVLVVWAASWIVGPGFAVGAGSSVSPFTTVIGPIPPIPMLGALPTSTPPAAFLVLLIPVVAGFAVGTVAARWAQGGAGVRGGGRDRRPAARDLAARDLDGRGPLGVGALAASAAAGGLLAGLVLGVLAAAASGSAGPGRLAAVGPDPVTVGLWAAVEIGVAAVAAVVAAGRGLGVRR